MLVHIFRVPNESFKAHISISCPLQRLTISIFQKPRLLQTKLATHPFPVSVCKNGLLTCNPQYDPFPIVCTLGDVVLGTKHEGSLDANDLVVPWVFS